MGRRGKHVAWMVVLVIVLLLSFHQYIIQHVFKLSLNTTHEATENEAETNILVDNVVGFNGSVRTEPKRSDDDSQIYPTKMKYHGHDLLKDPPHIFDANFKNPCWYERNQLRCLPYMFLIGVKKSGTSDLFKRMSLHPDFVHPGFKEAQWFARKRFSENKDNIDEYIDQLNSAAKSILNGANKSSNSVQNFRQVTGEASPSNLHLNSHWKYLPGNENMDEPKYVILDYIRHFLPKAKILIIFRDPVERLYSDYYHEYGSLMLNHVPNPQEFHNVVTKGVQAYNDCFQHHTIRSCVYNADTYHKTRIQIQLGIYFIFWQDLLRTFPRQQVLVLQNKNLRDAEFTMKTVHKFLELRELSAHEMKRIINTEEKHTRKTAYVKKGPMMNETLKLLQDFYAPFNKRMADLTGDSDFLYGHDMASGGT